MRDVKGRGRPPRGAGIALVAVLAALGLTACAGIPTSGPVHAGGGITTERNAPFIQRIAEPPRHAESAQDIVAGFLSASESFDNDHAVARQYLTSNASKTWNASAGVTVYDGSVAANVVYSGPTGGVITFTAPQKGTISQGGEYLDAVPGAKTKVRFQMSHVGGEWRISALPAGLVLDSLGVQRTYRPYDVYFPDPSWSVLVPEQILVPVGPGLSTSLVRAVLAGPTAWLAPAVRTAVPAGTKLVVDSVPIVDGVASVDLTSQATGAAGLQQAQAMSAQLVWTLRQVSDVTAVKLTIDRAPLQVPTVDEVQSLDAWPTFDPDGGPVSAAVLYANKGHLEVFSGNSSAPVPGPAGDGSIPLSRPAASFDRLQVAALSANGRRLYAGRIGKDQKLTAVIDGASSLTDPSYDRLGALWTVDRRPDGQPVVWHVTLGAAPTVVELQDLPPGRILSLQVARDGVRAAVVIQGANGHGQAYLARIQRTEGHLALAGFRQVRSELVDVTDVAWASADRLVMLGRSTAASAFQPWIVNVSGAILQSLGTLAPGTPISSVTAAPSEPVVVSSGDGKVWSYSGFQWESLGDGSWPAYPG